MSDYSRERDYLRSVCSAGDGFRWTTAVRVQTAITMHKRGEDVPVSGDAGLTWMGQE